jgi:hypothetical protein
MSVMRLEAGYIADLAGRESALGPVSRRRKSAVAEGNYSH